ncbi:MAG: hypothetical protein ACREFQ_02005, partial [Stellaceae bacterium]
MLVRLKEFSRLHLGYAAEHKIDSARIENAEKKPRIFLFSNYDAIHPDVIQIHPGGIIERNPHVWHG